jgi:hypothetical protein
LQPGESFISGRLYFHNTQDGARSIGLTMIWNWGGRQGTGVSAAKFDNIIDHKAVPLWQPYCAISEGSERSLQYCIG